MIPIAALYGALALLIFALLYSFHKSKLYTNFCLLHAVANRDGFYDQDRAHLTGAFLVTTFAVVFAVINQHESMELIVGGYASIWVVKGGWSYAVSKNTNAEVRREEIRATRGDEVDFDIGDKRERNYDDAAAAATSSRLRRRRADSE